MILIELQRPLTVEWTRGLRWKNGGEAWGQSASAVEILICSRFPSASHRSGRQAIGCARTLCKARSYEDFPAH